MAEHYTEAQQAMMLKLARDAIESSPALPETSQLESLPFMQAQRACFVTLQSHAQLRGCIGSLSAHRSLLDDLIHNARAAAFQDYRFAPLHTGEPIRIEISILSPLTPLEVKDESDLLAKLRPNIDGVVLQAGGHRATFLPSVWEMLPDPSLFMRQLKLKAGLPEDYWSDEVQIELYQVEHFCEAGETSIRLHPDAGT